MVLLVEVERLQDTPNGLTVKKLFERAWRVHGDLGYRRLAGISVSHIYNLRKSKGYRRRYGVQRNTCARTYASTNGESRSRRVVRAIYALTLYIKVTGTDTKVCTISMQ